MGQTNTINIHIINSMTVVRVVRIKCIYGVVLIPYYLATNFIAMNSFDRESGRGTSRSTGPSTYSLWTSDDPET